MPTRPRNPAASTEPPSTCQKIDLAGVFVGKYQRVVERHDHVRVAAGPGDADGDGDENHLQRGLATERLPRSGAEVEIVDQRHEQQQNGDAESDAEEALDEYHRCVPEQRQADAQAVDHDQRDDQARVTAVGPPQFVKDCDRCVHADRDVDDLVDDADQPTEHGVDSLTIDAERRPRVMCVGIRVRASAIVAIAGGA